MTHRFHTTGRDAWNEPRSPYNDAQRQWAYGPVQPMAELKPSLWRRLMGRGL